MKKFSILFILSALIFMVSCGGNSASKESANGNQLSDGEIKEKFKGTTLNILCWEGYADPKFTKDFEDKYSVTVKGTYFGSSDELVAKLQAGGGSTYDIVSPSCDVARYLIDAGLVQPVDTSRLANFDSLSTKLRGMKDVIKDGKVYGVPFTWGPDFLVYNADEVKETPTSWNIFWDAKYKGKIAMWDDISSLYLAGIVNGYAKNDPAAIYNMDDEQLKSVKQKLVSLKPNVRKYWSTAGELDNLMKNKEVVMAVGWPITPSNLNKQGMNIKYVIPEEGATGWIDRLMITANTANKDLAMAYLNYITTAEAMAKVAEVTQYSIANAGAAQYMNDDLKEVTHVNDADYYYERLNFWQPVKDRKKYNEIWNEVKAQ